MNQNSSFYYMILQFLSSLKDLMLLIKSIMYKFSTQLNKLLISLLSSINCKHLVFFKHKKIRNFQLFNFVQKILLFKSQNMKSPSYNPGQTSPSPFLGQDQMSEASLNPSFVENSQQTPPVGLQPGINNPKKRLKFDSILDQDLGDQASKISSAQSQSQIQIEFHVSNCLKAMSDFFKTNTFRYIYVTVLILFLINCTLEAANISDTVQKITQRIDLGIQIFFSIGIFVKLTQLQHQHAFWIVLDFITNLSAYLGFGLSSFPQPTRYLKAVKILRLLMIVKESYYLQVPAAKLIYSLSSVGKILFPAALFIYFYAIIGLYSFRDYEYTKCRDPSNKFLTSNWTVYEDSIFLCGQKQCPIVNGVQYQCLNPIDFGVEPNPYEVKNIMQGYGLMRYNNIFYALFSTFKQTFITGSSRLMILGKQVTNYFYVLIYYLSFIYLLAYIYLNIFYGLMITNEEQAVDSRRESSFELKLQQRRSSKKRTIQQGQKNEDEPQTQKPLNNNKKETKSMMIEQVKQSKTTLKKTLSTKLHNINEIQQSQKSEFQEVIDFDPTQKQNQNTIQDTGNNENTFDNRNSECNDSQASEKQQNLAKYGQIMKKYFFINHIIVILCSINILVDYEGQTNDVKLIVDAIDFVFFWVYFIEMIFRITVHMKYVPEESFDKAFKLDLILFCLCTCGLTYQVATAQNIQHFLMASDNASKLLRTLKYLRIFILISSTPYFNEARIIFNSTLEAVYSVKSFSGMWFLVLLTFSLMGYQMFQGKTKIDHHGHLDLENGHPQHVAFEGILDSLIYTVFIFFNEEWDWFLFEQYVNQEFLIVIWQLIVLVIGLQVLSKYFMALLMKQLGEKLNQQEQLAEQNEEDFIEDENEPNKIQSTEKHLNTVTCQSKKIARASSSAFTLKLKSKQSVIQPQLMKKNSHEKPQKMSRINININSETLQMKELTSPVEVKRKRTRRQSMMRDIIFRQTEEFQRIMHFNNINTVQPTQNLQNLKDNIPVHQSFLYKSRIKLFTFLKSRCYIIVKVIFILVSIVCTLIMNPNEDPNSQKTQVFTKIWYATMAFFSLDIISSIFAFGILKEKTGYFRNVMNWIYFLVFTIQILSIIPNLTESSHLQPLLSFRILRIFIFVELKYEADSDMRLTMVAFWKLLPKVANLLAITIIMYGFFAIILVKLYKDDYYYCDGYQSQSTIVTEIDCMSWGGSWIQRKMNVSNIFNSLLYLFLVATTQGWSVQIIESASLTGQGNEPEYGHSLWMQYFFSVFFFFGNMIMLNVFIGLSVYNFQKIKSQVTGLARLSKDNKMWFSIKNTIQRLKPKMKDTPPQNIISEKTHNLMNSKAYKIITTILLILFLINMSFYTTNMSDSKQKILDVILDVYIAIFIMEYIMLWVANGLRVVKKRIFLFSTIATIYFVILLVVTISMPIEPKLYRILYGIAICLLSIRCFAILNEIDFVRKMINSLVSIFPQTSNIWLLIFIVLFTYAVIGIYFFAYLKISPELNEFDQNYTDLPSAMYALIKFSTLESPMLQIIDSTSGIQPNSVCYDLYSYADFIQHGRMGCGRPVAGYIFFLSFQLIYTMILLSTLLAVIVDAYSEVRREEESMVNKFQLQEVQKEWENYDPQATGYISYRDFWIFTAKLVKIYKVNKEQLLSHDTKQSFLKSLEIPIYQDESGVLSFQFHEVVEALTRIVLKQRMGPDWNTKEADKVFKNHNHSNSDIKIFKKSAYDSSHVLTLIILKSGLKGWKRKAVNVENHQNFQNLFSIAKRGKKKTDSNHEITSQTMQINQVVKNQDKKVNQTSDKIPEVMTKMNPPESSKISHKNILGQNHDSGSSNFDLKKSPREPSSIDRNQNGLMVNNKSQRVQEQEIFDLEEIK